MEAIPRILKLELSLEVIAESLDLPLSLVQKIVNLPSENKEEFLTFLMWLDRVYLNSWYLGKMAAISNFL
ncbi:MAG: hypothetical protein SWX82_33980 [Cyanobacteriota bacterium]|nr:hypothetical protein [Cyanobacteriota bacterium]